MSAPFGPELLLTDFPQQEQREGFVHLNNGSFGACPTPVLAAQKKFQDEWKRNPDRAWYDTIQPAIVESRKAAARLLGAPADEVSLVENATTGMNIMAHRVMWDFVEGKCARGDLVVAQSSTYGAVKFALQAHCGRAGATVLNCEISFPPISASDALARWSSSLRALIRAHPGRQVRFVVLDHIHSENAIRYDVATMVKETRRVCREEGRDKYLEIGVDGAHGPGQVPVDVTRWDVDYYVGNLHKWCFAPNAVAVFWASSTPRKASLPAPLSSLTHPITSHNHGRGFILESSMQATKDYSSVMAVAAAVAYFELLGPTQVHDHVHETAWVGANMCARRWGTVVGLPKVMTAGMGMVELPREIVEGILLKATVTYGLGGGPLRYILRNEYGIETQTPYLTVEKKNIAGREVEVRRAWLRISAPVWVGPAAFEKLAKSVEDVVKRLKRGERFAKYLGGDTKL